MVVDPSITNLLFIVQMLWLLVTPYVFLAYYHYAVKPDLEKIDVKEWEDPEWLLTHI